MFQNLEHGDDNRLIPANTTLNVTAWIPWAKDPYEFNHKHIQPLVHQLPEGYFAHFIWQQDRGDEGDHIWYSTQGYDSATILTGVNSVGGDIALTIQYTGGVVRVSGRRLGK